MPTIHVAVPHQLGRDNAKARVMSLIADARTRFSGHVTNVTEAWDGLVDTFGFTAMGFAVTGKLEVQENQVLIEVNLPWAAYPLKGRLENEIKTRAEQLLAG